MENIINFIEQYWGVTLFGGITLGSIITFAITQVKNFISVKSLNMENKELGKQINLLCEQTEKKVAELNKQIEISAEKLLESEKLRAEQSQYFNKVQAATFKSISYLVMSSKLSSEDKASLLATINEVDKGVVDPAQNIVESAMYDTSVEKIVDTATNETKTIINTVEDTVNSVQNLFEKYK